MVKIRTEIKIAILFIIILLAFIWGYNFLKGLDFLKREDVYYAIYSNTDGLKQSAPVYLNGIQIGYVRSMKFLTSDYSKIIVEIGIDNDIKIHKGSIAEIYSYDIMGNKAIRILSSYSKEFHKPKDTIFSQIELGLKEQVSAQVLPLKLKAESLIKSIDSMLVALKEIFDPNTRNNIVLSINSLKQSLRYIEHSTGLIDTLLQEEKYRISNILYNLDLFTNNLQKNNEKISNILKNISNFTDTLKRINFVQLFERINAISNKLKMFLTAIEKKEGTLGQIVYNRNLYDSLEKTLSSLSSLINEIKENPDDYLNINLIKIGKRKTKNKKINSKN